MASRDGDGRARGGMNTALFDDNEEMASLIRSVMREQQAEADQDLRNEVNMLRDQLEKQYVQQAEADDKVAKLEKQLEKQLKNQHTEAAESNNKVLALEKQVESLTRRLYLRSTGSDVAPTLRQEGGEGQASAVTAAAPSLCESNSDDSNFDKFLSILSAPQAPPELRRGDEESQRPVESREQIYDADWAHEDSSLFATAEEGRGEGGLHGLGALARGGGGLAVSSRGDVEGYGLNQLQGFPQRFTADNYHQGEIQHQGLGIFAIAGENDRANVAPRGLVVETSAATTNETVAVRGTNNATQDENERKASAGISLYDRDTDTHYPFQESAFFFFITSHLLSVEVLLAALATAVPVWVMVLAIIDAFEDGEEGNLLDIPAGVSPPVRMAQVLAAIIAILSEQETYQGSALLKFAIKKSLHIDVENERIQMKQHRVFLASFCFLIVGSLFLINVVLSIIRADEVIALFYDILALEFVLNLDDITYGICKYFPLIKDAARRVKQLELDRPAATQSTRNWRLPFTTGAFFVKVLGVMFPLFVLFLSQQVGTYTHESIAVAFGEETWEQARVRGEDGTRVLLYSYFSGVYQRDGKQNGYARYVEQNKENGNPFDATVPNGTVPAEIIYCPKLESWVFFHPEIYKSADQDEGNCTNWLMRSSKTKSFDIVEAAGDNWETWVGTIQTGTSLSLYSNECGSDEDCNFNGKCKKKKCDCNENEDGTPLFFGRQCQLEMPCGVLVTENVEQGSQTQLLMVESDTTHEGFLKSYGRPIYYVTGLSGVPEALLSINPKKHGHRADRSLTEIVIDTGNEAFEDDDFFRESLKEFNENPLEDTLFDFGGTKISLRNYAVILAFSGSRWFATIDRPDFHVKDFYNVDYHAFWQNTYSDRTFLVSDPTSNGSPVGVEFYSPRRRKSAKDYGPFGILLPNSNIEGVGFFQCYANVKKCTFVDITVSTQNKSLPTNQGDYFSRDQIVSWKLESMEEGSNKIEQESPSVLLGAKFTHRYCLADGAYTYAIADDVCKSSWWECQHGPGNASYNISINDMPVVEENDLFQKSRFAFSVLQGGQEVQEDKNRNFCSGPVNFNLSIYTDGLPYETSWRLTNNAEDYPPLLKGGPYPFYNTFTTYDSMACLTDGDYNFTIFDSGGDGMIPPGHYDVMVGDRYIVQGGHLFGSSRSTPFSIIGGSLSLVPGISPTITSPNEHYCSEALFDVLGSSSTRSAPLNQNEISWSLFDRDKQTHVAEAQPLNQDDPRAPCLYAGTYTFIYEHLESECFGEGLSLFGSYNSLILYDGLICQNNTFSFLVRPVPNEKVGKVGNGTYTLTRLDKECMNDFHLVVSDDVTKGVSDGSWELHGKNGMNLRGDQFGDSSSTYYSHHACLGPGTYNFLTWKHPASQYTLSYRQSSLSKNVEIDFDQYVSGEKMPIVIDNSTLSMSWTDVGSTTTPGKSSNSDGGGWIVGGSGAGFGEKNDHMGNFDSFHYLYESFSEDMVLTILVEKFSGNFNNQSMGGIMFRDSLDARSRHYSMLLTGQNELHTSFRHTCQGCETIHADGANAGPNNIWLRVTKEGNWFTSYYKERDSREWNQFGSAEYVRFSSEDFFVGIAVTSHDEIITATLEVSNFEFVALRKVQEYGLTLWKEQKILPGDGAEQDNFGSSVALFGSTLLISVNAPYYDRCGVYVFVHDGEEWKEQIKLAPHDVTENGYFGGAVALDANTLVIGARGDEINGTKSGSAYVFVRDGADWREQAKLVPHAGADCEDFGIAVAVDGQTIVIGAGEGNDHGSVSVSAYVFVRHGEVWTEQAKLVPQDGAPGWVSSVVLNKDTIIIGAQGLSPGDSGSAYVFMRSREAWKEDAKLVARDGAPGAAFATSVALSGNIAVIGAPKELGAPYEDSGSGSAYVFIRDEEVWTEHAKLLHRDGAPYEHFGSSVALSGNIIVIGSPSHEEGSGSTHVFARLGEKWREVDKLLPNDGAQGDNFGWAVSLHNDTLVITSPFSNDNGAVSGSAYIFTTPMSELIRARTSPSLTAPLSSSSVSLASSPTASCVDVNLGINVIAVNVMAGSFSDCPESSWTLSRTVNQEGMRVQEVFFRGSSSFFQEGPEHDFADVMCLERGGYEFAINSRFGDVHYSFTVDGEVIARGGDSFLGKIVPFTIPFVLFPSSLPSASLSPSQMPSVSSVPSASSGPSSFPSASSPPSTSPIPTSSWSPSTFPSISISPSSCFVIEVSIFTDKYPRETVWTLSRTMTVDSISSAEVVLEGLPANKESHYTEAACLERGEYKFTVYDTGGNGICCGWWSGDGYYTITVGGKVVARGGEFQDEETISFTVPFVPSPPPSVYPSSSPSSSNYPSRSLSPSTWPSQVPTTPPSRSLSPSTWPSQVPTTPPSTTLIPSLSQVPSTPPSTSLSPSCSFFTKINIFTDCYPDETSWSLSRITTVNGISSAEGILEGAPENRYSYHTDAACLEMGNYEFTIYDSWGDGICCDGGDGHYNVRVAGNVIAVGGEFDAEEKVSFSIPFERSPPPSYCFGPWPVCPGKDNDEYCDGEVDCDTDFCKCPAGEEFCNTGINPCEGDSGSGGFQPGSSQSVDSGSSDSGSSDPGSSGSQSGDFGDDDFRDDDY